MIIETNIKEYITVIKPYKKLSSVQLGAVGELVDPADLKSAEPKGSCRFESGQRYKPPFVKNSWVFRVSKSG